MRTFTHNQTFLTMKFFFVSTKHLEQRLWFKDSEDFKTGMNYVAVVVAKTSVNVLAFILMSNHVHFLLECSRENADCVMVLFKTLYGRYYRKKYGGRRLLRHNHADIQEVSGTAESLERVLAYIQQNSVAARICLYCSDYPWGTGGCFFNMRPMCNSYKVGKMSARGRNRLLKSTIAVPGNWLVNNEGYVLPESYVCRDFVEKLFRSPTRMDFFLKNSSKSRCALEQTVPSFRDQVLLEAAKDLANSIFHKQFDLMSYNEKSEYLKTIRWRFSTDINQICRILGISYQEASGMLDKV